jgi:hypothetical protein
VTSLRSSSINDVIFSIFLWSAAGALFGFLMWRQGEMKYKKAMERRGDSVTPGA